MLFSNLLLLAFGGAGLASAKFSWTFEDATVSVQGKGTGEGGQFTKEKSVLTTIEIAWLAGLTAVSLDSRPLDHFLQPSH